MQWYLNFYQFCYCKHFKWPSIYQVLCYSPGLQFRQSKFMPLEYSFIVGVDGKKDKERPYLNHLQSVKTCNCFRNTLIRSHRMLSRS